ncbi:hypothetical protein AB0B81_16365, partial [Streptomyces sp. NPDC039028]
MLGLFSSSVVGEVVGGSVVGSGAVVVTGGVVVVGGFDVVVGGFGGVVVGPDGPVVGPVGAVVVVGGGVVDGLSEADGVPEPSGVPEFEGSAGSVDEALPEAEGLGEPELLGPPVSPGPPSSPSAGSSPSVPSSRGSSVAVLSEVTWLVAGSSPFPEVAPSVTTVPRTATSSAPAPTAARLRRAPLMMPPRRLGRPAPLSVSGRVLRGVALQEDGDRDPRRVAVERGGHRVGGGGQ